MDKTVDSSFRYTVTFFFLIVIVLKLKLRNTKSIKKRQAIAILEKGSPLAALTVADLLEDSIETRVRGQAQHCGSPGNVLIIKILFCPNAQAFGNGVFSLGLFLCTLKTSK